MSRNIHSRKRKDKKTNLLPYSMVAERMRQLGAFAALLMFIFSSLSTSQLMFLEMNSSLAEDPHFASGRSGNDTDSDGIDDIDDTCANGDTGWTSNATTDHDSDGCRDSSEDPDDDNDSQADPFDDCQTGDLLWTSNLTTDLSLIHI